jgi:DNA adenine methylase Dam
MKALKTPLRYPGGKSRAVTKMDRYFPNLENYKEYREPFLGGGSVAVHITKKHPNTDVWVNDLYKPLYIFWKQLQSSGEELKELVLDYKFKYNNPESARELFTESNEKIFDESLSELDRAARFYIVNKCSFSGLSGSSSFSPQASDKNFTINNINKFPGFSSLIKNWKITNFSYEELIVNSEGCFVYLDPPYDIKDNLYGNKGSMHKGFDHDKFALDCEESSSDMLISYNSDQLVKDRFLNWNSAEFDLTYTMRSVGEYMKEQKERKELLIFNYGTEGLVEFD